MSPCLLKNGASLSWSKVAMAQERSRKFCGKAQPHPDYLQFTHNLQLAPTVRPPFDRLSAVRQLTSTDDLCLKSYYGSFLSRQGSRNVRHLAPGTKSNISTPCSSSTDAVELVFFCRHFESLSFSQAELEALESHPGIRSPVGWGALLG